MEVTKGDTPVGYIWLTHVASELEPILELHLCVHPDWKRRWLTRRVLSQGFKYLSETDARYILAIHTDPELRDIMCRLGFKRTGEFINILDLNEVANDGFYHGYIRWGSRARSRS